MGATSVKSTGYLKPLILRSEALAQRLEGCGALSPSFLRANSLGQSLVLSTQAVSDRLYTYRRTQGCVGNRPGPQYQDCACFLSSRKKVASPVL